MLIEISTKSDSLYLSFIAFRSGISAIHGAHEADKVKDMNVATSKFFIFNLYGVQDEYRHCHFIRPPLSPSPPALSPGSRSQKFADQ